MINLDETAKLNRQNIDRACYWVFGVH